MAVETFLQLGILAVVGIGAAVGLSIFLAYNNSHRLILIDRTKGNPMINYYWVDEKKDKQTGVETWESVWFQKKVKTPIPPHQAIKIMAKGRKLAIAYKLTPDEFIWTTEGEITNETILPDGKRVLDAFKPFSVVQRETIVNQHIKAAEISAAGKWTADKIIAMTSIMALVILVICVLMFYGDIAKPALESHKLALEVQRQNVQILQAMNVNTKEISQTVTPVTNDGTTLAGTEKPPIAK